MASVPHHTPHPPLLHSPSSSSSHQQIVKPFAIIISPLAAPIRNSPSPGTIVSSTINRHLEEPPPSSSPSSSPFSFIFIIPPANRQTFGHHHLTVGCSYPQQPFIGTIASATINRHLEELPPYYSPSSSPFPFIFIIPLANRQTLHHHHLTAGCSHPQQPFTGTIASATINRHLEEPPPSSSPSSSP